jgi:uncharacterized membrane protein
MGVRMSLATRLRIISGFLGVTDQHMGVRMSLATRLRIISGFLGVIAWAAMMIVVMLALLLAHLTAQ